MVASSFEAGIDLATADTSKLITDRIASRMLTRETRKRCDVRKLGMLGEYRQKILARLRKACPTTEIGDELATKFRNLAENLEYTKAIAVAIEDQAVNEKGRYGLQNLWQSLLGGDTAYGGSFLGCNEEFVIKLSNLQGLFHPLLIALLAYRMGGAVNAVFTAQARQWKLPEQSESQTGLENFHVEGGEKDIFSDQRMTLVWEEHSKKPRGMSGSHHVFLGCEGNESHILQTYTLSGANQVAMPSTVLYDSKNATIMYQCQDKDLVRHSISLDFCLQPASNDELDLLYDHPGTVCQDPTLGELLLGFPIPKYDHYFHKLVFEKEPLDAIVSKLSSLDIPAAAAALLQNEDALLKEFELYSKDNAAMIPNDILNMTKDIHISGEHDSTGTFFVTLILKAQRDIHLALDADLVPQIAIEDNRECARKFIRDMPSSLVIERLERYTHDVFNEPYAYTDLVSTSHMQGMAITIEKCALQAAAEGFVDETSVLISLPSFVNALGKALNGTKAIQTDENPLVDELDFQIYRTRCLYLFWCADWLVTYLGNPKRGLFPLPVKDVALAHVQNNLAVMGKMLLRNWVAWAIFVEGCPRSLRTCKEV